eukprot:9211312-Alexandrium_andersonii.AAC.1
MSSFCVPVPLLEEALAVVLRGLGVDLNAAAQRGLLELEGRLSPTSARSQALCGHRVDALEGCESEDAP